MKTLVAFLLVVIGFLCWLMLVTAPALPTIAANTGLPYGRTSRGPREIYHLYRNSNVDGIPHIHVATFNANDDSEEFNRVHCLTVVDLFNPEAIKVGVRFWCARATGQ